MFKHYRELQDVVSLMVYCTSDKSFLLLKETSGEYWIPSIKSEKNSWKMSAHKLLFELFGTESGAQLSPLRVNKVWLPAHPAPCVYHTVYKLTIRADVKKRLKVKPSVRFRLQWVGEAELGRLQAHCALRSPELLLLATMFTGEPLKEADLADLDKGQLVEVGEESVLVGAVEAGVAAGAGGAASAAPSAQLLAAANYTKEDQMRLFREFVTLNFPALYMSQHVFSQLMLDIGWHRTVCNNLFRAADVSNRGGLSFQELVLWSAATEPVTQHSGLPAEIRCRYIFRYYDGDRDQKLQQVEVKELVAAARATRQLSTDALSVVRDVDLCYKQLGLQANSPLSLADFLRAVRELRLRGTSSLLRAPRSLLGYVIDLQERDCMAKAASVKSTTHFEPEGEVRPSKAKVDKLEVRDSTSWRRGREQYALASCVVRLEQDAPPAVLRLDCFEEEAVSASTIKLLSLSSTSLEVLAADSGPAETLAAVHYFASDINTPKLVKPAYTWAQQSELAALGAAVLKLSESVQVICAAEPRLLRLDSPIYAIGDLHGNLPALLAMEARLWPAGAALLPAGLLFLGDFVDRGAWGVELLAYLLAAKLQRPRGLHLVRGNHETRDIQTMFTFYTECTTKFGDVEGVKIWNAINNVFDVLPLAAVVDEKVFCCHGGIPPPWVCPRVSAILRVPVPLPRPAAQSHMAWELLWNDPVKANKITASMAMELSANEGFAVNARRGTGHVFDQRALDRFLAANDLTHVVRAHELHQNGFMCNLRGKLISVFSSSRYCGGDNDSGVVLLQAGKLRLIRLSD
ncbi:uncharacterized protein LOC106719231 [Papilio machaon]|uniref:uncharacterized protein LOC106719231 n=1 Tax=Papilio machaon TaxID=76193 RepID=UPI001E663E91|nr:uncharacterized protein LOC106719231 [Papilio machaon]